MRTAYPTFSAASACNANGSASTDDTACVCVCVPASVCERHNVGLVNTFQTKPRRRTGALYSETQHLKLKTSLLRHKLEYYYLCIGVVK